jgi:predicted component of type VI protein secretion system
MFDGLYRRLTELSYGLKHMERADIDLDEVRSLLRLAADYIATLERIIPNPERFEVARTPDPGELRVTITATILTESAEELMTFLGEKMT